MSGGIIQSFLVSLGFTVDTGSARAVQNAARRVEETIRRSDQARTRSAAEQLMERARIALKAQGIEGAGMALLQRKAKEIEAEDAAAAKRRSERVVQFQRLAGRTVSAARVVGQAVIASTLAVEAAAVSISKVAQVAAERLEAMAYSADRTGSSVASLKSFSAAVAQLGGTAGGALADLEAFAYRLRENPQGYANFLKTVGVNAYDAQGKIRGAAELYKEFRTEVGKKPYHIQLQYMQEMGVSEQTWRATDPAKLAEQEKIQRERYARMKFDPDAAKDDAVKLQQSYRGLMDTFGIIGEKATSAIFKQVGPNIERLTGFLEKNGDKIADVMAKVAQVVLAVAQALLELATSDTVQGFLGWLLKSFGEVDKGSGQWVADIDKIKLAMEALAVFIATVFVAKIKGAIAEVMGDIAPFVKMVAPFLGVLGIGGGLAGLSIGTDLGTPNAVKPGVITRSDDENTGAADSSGAMGALKRGYGAVKRGVGKLLGFGAEAKEGPQVGAARPLTRQQLDIGKGSPEVEGYIRKKAGELGIDPDTAVAVANSENLRGFDPSKADPGGDGGTSFGPYQLHYGGKGTGPNASPGLGDEFTKETGKDARDPSTWQAQVDFALARAKAGGWGPWHGAARAGIGRYQGIQADKSGGGRLGLGGTAAARGTDGVDPRLLGIIGEASKSLPDGYSAKIISGLRPGDSRFHGQGLAADVAIYDKGGNKLPNYQDAGAFRTYEQFAQAARRVQMERHPDLDKSFRWGGYFGGPPGKYGALDTMHFDLGGGRVGMGGGSWEHGLTPEQRRLFPGATSEGMGKTSAKPTTVAPADPSSPTASPASDAAARVGEAANRLRENAGAMAERIGDAASRLDPDRMGVLGKATEGFNPRDYFKAPPLGDNTTNNSSTKNVSFNQGATTNNIYNYGKSQDGMDMYERHRKRMMADDVRYASSVYASA